MRYETSEKALYNQLLYFRRLWDVEKDSATAAAAIAVKGPKAEEGEEGKEEKENDREKIKAVAEWNRERFDTCKGVVDGYLNKCGRVWVQMDALFGFALGK